MTLVLLAEKIGNHNERIYELTQRYDQTMLIQLFPLQQNVYAVIYTSWREGFKSTTYSELTIFLLIKSNYI